MDLVRRDGELTSSTCGLRFLVVFVLVCCLAFLSSEFWQLASLRLAKNKPVVPKPHASGSVSYSVAPQFRRDSIADLLQELSVPSNSHSKVYFPQT